MYLIKFSAAAVIWTCIIGTFLVQLGAGTYLIMYYTSNDWSVYEDTNKENLCLTGSIVCLVLAALTLCLVCCLRSRINLAIGIVKVNF